MTTMSYAEQVRHLRAFRLPYSTAAQRHASWEQFQGAWSLGPKLDVDGIPGKHTTDAARLSASQGYRLSPHFTLAETACKHCGKWKAIREGFELLERIRAKRSPGGLTILTAYRCPVYNATIKGHSDTSAHMLGLAWDFQCHRADGSEVDYTGTQMKGLGARGIEERLNPRRVTHIDLKPSHPFDFIFHP
jgi:hypothetical protein